MSDTTPTIGTKDLRVADVIETATAAAPDGWTLEYWHTGGGIFCIVADHPSIPVINEAYPDERNILYVGDASGDVGWSDSVGDLYGGFTDEEQDTAEALGTAIANLVSTYVDDLAAAAEYEKNLAAAIDRVKELHEIGGASESDVAAVLAEVGLISDDDIDTAASAMFESDSATPPRDEFSTPYAYAYRTSLRFSLEAGIRATTDKE